MNRRKKDQWQLFIALSEMLGAVKMRELRAQEVSLFLESNLFLYKYYKAKL